MFNDVFEMHKFSELCNCICYELLAHRAENDPRDDNKCDLKELKDEWGEIKKLSKKIPTKIVNTKGIKFLKIKSHPIEKYSMELRKKAITCKQHSSRSHSFKCCFPKCDYANIDENVTWHRVPPEPKKLKCI